MNDFWEPVYHAVVANGFVYDPGAGGTIFKLNKADGSVATRINPFDELDSNTFTASPLSTDSAGNIYYNVVRITGNSPSFYSHDVVNSWLVKVGPDDSVTKVDLPCVAEASNNYRRARSASERRVQSTVPQKPAPLAAQPGRGAWDN